MPRRHYPHKRSDLKIPERQSDIVELTAKYFVYSPAKEIVADLVSQSYYMSPDEIEKIANIHGTLKNGRSWVLNAMKQEVEQKKQLLEMAQDSNSMEICKLLAAQINPAGSIAQINVRWYREMKEEQNKKMHAIKSQRIPEEEKKLYMQQAACLRFVEHLKTSKIALKAGKEKYLTLLNILLRSQGKKVPSLEHTSKSAQEIWHDFESFQNNYSLLTKVSPILQAYVAKVALALLKEHYLIIEQKIEKIDTK